MEGAKVGDFPNLLSGFLCHFLVKGNRNRKFTALARGGFNMHFTIKQLSPGTDIPESQSFFGDSRVKPDAVVYDRQEDMFGIRL